MRSRGIGPAFPFTPGLDVRRRAGGALRVGSAGAVDSAPRRVPADAQWVEGVVSLAIVLRWSPYELVEHATDQHDWIERGSG